jgi:hypothetical protein
MCSTSLTQHRNIREASENHTTVKRRVYFPDNYRHINRVNLEFEHSRDRCHVLGSRWSIEDFCVTLAVNIPGISFWLRFRTPKAILFLRRSKGSVESKIGQEKQKVLTFARDLSRCIHTPYKQKISFSMWTQVSSFPIQSGSPLPSRSMPFSNGSSSVQFRCSHFLLLIEATRIRRI